MFSAITGLALAALGAALASSGITGWGLFTVALGILAVTFVSRLGASSRPMALAYADSASHNHNHNHNHAQQR
tara:strand:- start:119828 stop:120046 length:219 start_codon:yes stop_codon:yes gene_type:complete